MKSLTTLLVLLFLAVTGCGEKKQEAKPKKIYGNDPETRKKFADALDRMTDKTPTVTITKSAAKRIKELQKERNQEYARLQVQHYGPTGLVCELSLDNRISYQNDILNKWHGVEILIDKRTAEMVRGTKIDWKGMKNGKDDFEFDIPGEKDAKAEDKKANEKKANEEDKK